MAEKNFSSVDATTAGKYVKKILTNPFTRRQRIMAVGEPGCGKTEMFEQMCAELGWELITLHLSQLDVGAFRGLERIVEVDGVEITVPVRPHFLPPYVADEDIDENTPRYMILLDEILSCDDAIRKSGFEVLTSHRSGPHLLGSNVVIVCATNTAEDGTNVHEMDRATKRRFTYIGVHATAASFVAWGRENGVHHAVLSFIKNNPSYINPSEEDFANDNLATPNSASLVKCSDTLKAYEAGFLNRDDVEYNLQGNIGMMAGNELLLQMEDEEARFDLDNLVNAAPEDREYPKNVFGVHSLGNALYTYSTTPERFDKAIDIMMDMPSVPGSHAYEAKTSFILQISDKITQFRRYSVMIQNPKILQLLEDTKNLTKFHDMNHEAMEKEAETADDQAAALQAA